MWPESAGVVVVVGLVLCQVLSTSLAAEVLAVFPHTGKSHFDVFAPLVQDLASRGHNVTVISFYPRQPHMINYTDISLVGVSPLLVNALTVEHISEMNPFTDFLTITNLGVESCTGILMSEPVQNLLKSPKIFDLLMIEVFNTDCFLGFVNKYRVPYIGIMSSSILPHHYPRLGSFDNPSYFPNAFLPLGSHMSLVERIVNTVVTAGMRLAKAHQSLAESEAAAASIGEGASLEDIACNASVVLINSHWSYHGPRPLPPSCVEVGGLHIRPAQPLSTELERFMDESSDGVLLFSMGSVIQSTSFPADKRHAIMDAFAELPVQVLMKWESDTLPGKPPNVKLSRWLPQRDILAHAKVRAFMGHGGMLSTSEALHCGVPMVLIPMFGDQPNNVAHLAQAGVAIPLSYDNLSKETVLQALQSVLNDPRYRLQAQAVSAQFRDRPMSPLETAVYWTEYVIRHKGATHLRSPAVDMPWYQLWLLDVLLVVCATFTALLIAVYWMAKCITKMVNRLFFSKKTKNKKE
ncbi:UDP-glycosyltransferase UGT5-like isoform X1 [Macrosteles quadrilineatus]|uniref:UDP-glycosyltransferase UGT5-like isoform X1 n=1 Tax=Macrosteles quadrilineatus TaxID=74068 RepID=UPI0023E2E442|nr:UDP-glycosyltransferase UGT5-like isoform X1 [Macrosteles quadrilineatus]